MTGGFVSDVYEKRGIIFTFRQTLMFNDQERPIRSVMGADKDGKLECIGALRFLDQNGTLLANYDPESCMDSIPGKTHTLRENEHIIGVYGKNCKDASFSAFGFLIRAVDL